MVCIEKRPYTLYGRLATLHFRYLTCLLDRGHISIQRCFYVNNDINKKRLKMTSRKLLRHQDDYCIPCP